MFLNGKNVTICIYSKVAIDLLVLPLFGTPDWNIGLRAPQGLFLSKVLLSQI